MSGVCLLVMTDGRKECIKQTIPSALAQLRGDIARRVIHDDSGDRAHRDWLRINFPTFEVLDLAVRRQGFGGAIRRAWDFVHHCVDEPWVFHLEDDFVFNEEIDLNAMQNVLLENTELVQMTLKRQAWNEEEGLAGGLVERHPEAYTECVSGLHRWTEHQLYFSTNPSLYRQSLTSEGWPTGSRSEGVFTQRCRDKGNRFAFWGAKYSAPKVTHIGHQRMGMGY